MDYNHSASSVRTECKEWEEGNNSEESQIKCAGGSRDNQQNESNQNDEESEKNQDSSQNQVNEEIKENNARKSSFSSSNSATQKHNVCFLVCLLFIWILIVKKL